MKSIPEYEQRLQRWAGRRKVIVIIAVAILVVLVGVLIAVGTAYAQGGIRCFVDADARTLKCFTPSGEFSCVRVGK